MLSGNQIRERFLNFFVQKGHTPVPSSSLLPLNDPTLFFTNAGMVPFKDLFTGREKRGYVRAVSSQKCMRVSGKHNDLENVGRTPRHHTFFEMLGNFSFGDYFKKEAIAYAWEFLTKTVGLDKSILWMTIFHNDEEAFTIWRQEIGISGDRIVRCGEEENFWAMGETGPCGPCSEIHVDLSLLLTGKPSSGNPATHPDDFMEVWNLVFMQFDRDDKGKLVPLPKPSIDTGMGLERLCAVLQKKKSNYDTDLFLPLIQSIQEKTHKVYGKNEQDDVAMRVLADHIRSSVFLVSDGVQPSNEGRGYVLRRIMRRAIRHGKMLGRSNPFFFELAGTLVGMMQEAYPDLAKNSSLITKVIQTEEIRFLETLDRGMEMIEEEVSQLKKKGEKIFSGKTAFVLYDTYGFPLDLTELITAERGLSVDSKIFEEEMSRQKKRARSAWKGSGESAVADLYHELVRGGMTSQFLGYETMEAKGRTVALIKEGKRTDEAGEGEQVEIFVDRTPFYGESGGQVGDTGIMIDGGAALSGRPSKFQIEVSDTQKPLEGIISHHGLVKEGIIRVGDSVLLRVNNETRRSTMLNHTATHILHAALREILGDHVKQAGSLVKPERLRFDFTHFEPLTKGQIEAIELQVNTIIQSNYPVAKEEMSLEEAKKKGALAFFGDKYGERVRVVSVGPPGVLPYSMEFCGGTHLDYSGEIGVFKIIGESSVASGVRRIEAVTGLSAFAEFQRLGKMMDELSSLLKTTPAELPQRVAKLSEEAKKLQREISQLKAKMVSGGEAQGDLSQLIREVKGIKVITLETDLSDPKDLRNLGDELKVKMGSGLVLIGSKSEGKALIMVMVTKDLTGKYNAGKLVGELAPIIGGRGGGGPDMAQAGGNQPEKLAETFKKLEDLL